MKAFVLAYLIHVLLFVFYLKMALHHPMFINRSLCCTEVVLDVVFAPLELLCFDVITKMCKLRFFTV